MRAPVTPPSIRSLRLRYVLIGLFMVAIPVAAAGCKAGPAATTDASSAASDSTETPTPAGTTLLTLTGKGPKTSDDFHASGDSVEVTSSYTCATPGSFTLNFYGTNGSPTLPDILTDDFGAQGAATTTESLNGASGPFHLEVVSECEWSIKVVGTP